MSFNTVYGCYSNSAKQTLKMASSLVCSFIWFTGVFTLNILVFDHLGNKQVLFITSSNFLRHTTFTMLDFRFLFLFSGRSWKIHNHEILMQLWHLLCHWTEMLVNSPKKWSVVYFSSWLRFPHGDNVNLNMTNWNKKGVVGTDVDEQALQGGPRWI